tara:strand:+ start:88 stop:1260 length:1173 start_codon:yes stop_codon:yes gene_type:complete
MVPEGWKLCPLGALVSFANGKAHEKDISEDGKYILVNSKFISTEGRVYKRSHEAFCPARSHDVLMVMSDVPNGRAIAKCFYVMEDGKYTVNQRIARLRADKVDSKFLFYAINRNSYYLRFDDGITQTNLRKDEVLECPVRTPPLPEQKKIAQILSTWDQAITATERLLENSQQRKKGLMQQLLTGKKRLLRFEGEWESLRLRDLLKEEKARNKELSIMRVLSVTNHSGFVLPEEQFSKRVASDNVSNYRIVRKGQYGYNPSRLNVGSFARLDTYDEGLLSPMYVVFSVNEARLNNDYFLNWMKSNEAKQRIAGSTQGSVRDSVGFDALCNFPFRLPPLDEQQKIADVLVKAEREVDALKERVFFLKQEKKALMQQLLTGKRRVKVDSEAA